MKKLVMPVFGILSDDERQAVEAFYRAIGEGRPELLDLAVTPDWQDIPLTPNQSPGREGMKPMIEAILVAFPDLRITIHGVIGTPGHAAVRAEITGTHFGEWLGVPATKKAFRVPLHDFHRIENGLLTQTWHLEDWFGWLAQMAPHRLSEATGL